MTATRVRATEFSDITGLLDTVLIRMVPVVLGDGLRLFEHLDAKRLELQRTRVTESPTVVSLEVPCASRSCADSRIKASLAITRAGTP
jgi:dihydrofolate reductase